VVIGAAAKESENAFVGGANRWAYDSFVNWEFWWPAFPCLVYFKVGWVGGGWVPGKCCQRVCTQGRGLLLTPLADVLLLLLLPPLAAAVLCSCCCSCRRLLFSFSALLQETQTKPEGQIHFFPIIMDGGQLYKVMSERCGPSQGSGPK
jgi:hypothetical protein